MNWDGNLPLDLPISWLLLRPLVNRSASQWLPRGVGWWRGGRHSFATSVPNVISVFFCASSTAAGSLRWEKVLPLGS